MAYIKQCILVQRLAKLIRRETFCNDSFLHFLDAQLPSRPVANSCRPTVLHRPDQIVDLAARTLIGRSSRVFV